MKKLEDKTALITGASRGIGRAIALRLASEGAFVLIHCGHGTREAEATLRAVTAAGGRGAVLVVDLAARDGATRLREEVDAALSRSAMRLDVLVNNAGVGLIAGLADTTEEQFDRVFAINVRAPFFLLKELAPRVRDGGRIINVTSFVTRVALPAVGAYAMTKAAMSTMTLWLAKELGARGITVNAVAPGVIDTEMNAAALSNPDARRAMESMSVFGAWGSPKTSPTSSASWRRTTRDGSRGSRSKRLEARSWDEPERAHPGARVGQPIRSPMSFKLATGGSGR